MISLFVPFILADLAFSNSVFGGYYALATVISSVIMLRVGHVIDDRPIRPFTIQTTLLLAVACVVLALAWHPAVLFVALVGLRLAGQGLLSHISLSTMSRYFSRDRGKALSFSSLGYSVGEMIFPILVGAVIAAFGWRVGAMTTAGLTLVLLAVMPLFVVERLDYVPGKGRIGKPLPGTDDAVKPGRTWWDALRSGIASVLDRSDEHDQRDAGTADSMDTTTKPIAPGLTEVASRAGKPVSGTTSGLAAGVTHNADHASAPTGQSPSKPAEAPMGKRAFYWQMLKESRFYVLLLPSFYLSFTVTGFFFYQYLMAESRGWPIATYTYLFAGYGFIRLLAGLYGGVLTDKYNTATLFVVHLIPMALGILGLALVPGLPAAAVFLFGTGMSTGSGMVFKNAILAEMYGVGRIGQVRSLFTMFMVLSTALAPLLFGLLLDGGVSFAQLAVGSTIAAGLVVLHTTRIYGLKG
ncbi:MAG: MFS family transporter [Bacteroidetes bacterium HLUCCA01]|nr:MAG: MFS family transporter [Bacteroidetes bacterium HLUCCA01]